MEELKNINNSACELKVIVKSEINDKDLFNLTSHLVFSKILVVWFIMLVIWLLLFIANFFLKNFDILVYIFAAVLVVLPVIEVIILKVASKNKRFKNLTQEFEFYNKHIIIKEKTNYNNTTSEISWQMIKKAEERKKYFYLLVNNVSAFIVKKDGFIEGNEDILRQIIKANYKFKK